MFVDFAAVPDNVVLLTTKGEEGTFSRALFDKWNDSQRPDDKWDKGKIGRNVMMDGTIKMLINRKVLLSGVELEIYQQKERETKEKEAAQQVAIAVNQRMLEADADDTDSDSDSESADEDEVQLTLADGGVDMGPDGIAEGKEVGKKNDRRLDSSDWLDGDEGLTKQVLSFDIYLKGNVSKSTSFFKNTGHGPRFRMFPYVEKKRRVDDYGETIDVGMWLRKGKALEEEAESEEVKDLKRKAAEEEAKVLSFPLTVTVNQFLIQKNVKEPPFKFVSSEVEIQLACRLLFIDMDGLNDGRAVKSIVPQVNPRKMVCLIVFCSNDY